MTVRILIIDDDPLILAGLTQGLVAQGHSVMAYQDPFAGERALHDQDWDAVILDLAMPGRSGVDILAAMPAAVVARTIVCSATTDPALIYPAQAYPLAGYLTKPVRLAALRALVAEVAAA